jgi:hypothetical protein
MQGLVNLNQANVTLWFAGVSPATLTDLENLGDALSTWWQAELTPITSLDFSLESVYLLAQDSNTSPFTTRTTGLPSVGSVGSAIVSPQTAPVIKFITASRGRSGRGRNYIPGCPLASLSTPGVISGGARTAYLNAYIQLAGAVGAVGYTHIVVSHFHNDVALTVGNPQAVIGYDIVDNALGTQRKRRIGVGS